MVYPVFKDIREHIIRELKLASKEINVAVCWFTSTELFNVLCEKLEDKILVNLIVLNDDINNKPNGLDFQKFIDLGGKFYFSDLDRPMHNKYCIIDATTVINGSYNWTYFAENKNNENINILKAENVANEFLADFNRLVNEYKLISSIKDSANTETSITIVEDAQIVSSEDVIIKSKKGMDVSKLTLKNSLGLSIVGDKFFMVFPKNSKIPISKDFELITIADNQTQMDNHIVFGENNIASQNQTLGSFIVTDVPPMPKGEGVAQYTLSIDYNGILTVKTKVKATGKMTIESFSVSSILTGFI